MNDPYNLQRFIDAQHGVYEAALEEIRSGQKKSHWMWFVFPQLAGLGRSPTAHYYGISSLDEARSYLRHPLLGPRLRASVEALLRLEGLTAEEILGPIDSQKLGSSLTLFDQVDPNALFAAGLAAFYAGKPDGRTLALLNAQQ